MTLRFDLPAKVILMTGPHPECQRRICTRNEGAGKASSWSDSEGSIAVVRKAIKCYQSHRFFTQWHCPAFPFFPQNILIPVQNDHRTVKRHNECQRRICTHNEGVGKASSWSDSEGSIAVVRKALKCHKRLILFSLFHGYAFTFFPQNILIPV